jgi:hypothetical protein
MCGQIKIVLQFSLAIISDSFFMKLWPGILGDCLIGYHILQQELVAAITLIFFKQN